MWSPTCGSCSRRPCRRALAGTNTTRPCLDNPPDMTAAGDEAGRVVRDYHDLEAYLTGSHRAGGRAVILASDYYGQYQQRCSFSQLSSPRNSSCP
jgi:hypothetical protein